MKYKKRLIIFTTLFSVAVFLSIFFMMWFWSDEYEDFDTNTFREEIVIPGLKDGVCPQGLATVKHTLYGKDGEPVYVTDADGNLTEQPKTQEYYFISAYLKNKPSRIYVTGKESGCLGYVSLTYHGEPFKGHVGGIATSGSVFWVGSENKVYCLKRTNNDYANIADEIIKLSLTNSKLELDPDPDVNSVFEINGRADFVSYYKSSTSTGNTTERLYVGEFYRAGNYDTDESHHITLPDGSVNRAFMYEYNISTTSTEAYGLATISPADNEKTKYSKIVPKVQKIYSIPDKIQGFARVSGSNDSGNGDTFVFSQSYGLSNSEILLYNCKTIDENANHVLYSSIHGGKYFEYPDVMYGTNEKVRPHYEQSVNVYYVYGNSSSKKVDNEGRKIYPSFIKSYSLPCMSEGLAVSSDDRVNILFESAAKKYKTFVRQSIDKIYSFRPPRSGR